MLRAVSWARPKRREERKRHHRREAWSFLTIRSEPTPGGEGGG